MCPIEVYIIKNPLVIVATGKKHLNQPTIAAIFVCKYMSFQLQASPNDTKNTKLVISESTQPHAKARDIFHDLPRANIDLFAKQVIFLSKLHNYI